MSSGERSVDSTELTGYAGHLSVAPGDPVSFHISSSEPEVDLRIVRLIHGDTNPDDPGHKEVAVEAAVEGHYPGRVQRAHAGSFGLVEESASLLSRATLTIAAVILPTTPTVGRDQGIVSLWSESARDGVSLYIDDRGVVAFWAGSVSVGADAAPLHQRRWYLVAGGFDNGARTAKVFVQPIGRLVSVEPLVVVRELSNPAQTGLSAPLLLGALPRPGRVECARGRNRALQRQARGATTVLTADVGHRADRSPRLWCAGS
jgi:N,N-dimethylformamidase